MIDPRLLRDVRFLHGLRAETLEALAARAVERRFASDEVLFTAGSESRGLYIVLEGRVRVMRASGGRQHVVHDERAGGTLGEVPLFDGGGYPATAVAAEPTRCAIIDRPTLAAAMHSDPDMAWTLLARLAARVRTLVARVDTLASDDVSTRLAALIVSRLDAVPRATTFTLGATQHAVAEELGTVREVVVKELRRLREAGVIRAAGRGRWTVVDEKALRVRAQGHR